MAPQPVAALSHVSISAPSYDLHARTVAFYNRIGFRTILNDNASLDAGGLPEAWLQLFAQTRADDAGKLELVASGLTLRIVVQIDPLFDPTKYNADLQAKTAALLAESEDTAAFDPTLGCFTVFSDSDLKILEAGFSAANYPFKLKLRRNPKKDGSLKCLIAYDTLGNRIGFSEAAPAFANPLPRPPNPGTLAALSLGKSPRPAFAEAANPKSPDVHGKSLEDTLPMASAWTLIKGNSETATKSKNIGILTSGGDSQGMNAAVRAITRVTLQRGCTPYAIYEGYQGLVDGGNMIRKLGWEDVRGILGLGGTAIGTARCLAFRQREGRLQAAYNMISNGIDALIVVGGDGSLTGADLLRSEWSSLVDELISTGRVKESECAHLRHHLHIVGLVGSIDNDMAATDMTIGAVTSLHRICEALDSLASTAMSHQRAFVVEVMGRHCGWLALMAAIAVGADWVFLPERPPPLDPQYGDNWETELCDRLKKQREMGNRKSLIIIAEGAIDKNLNPIKPEYVKSVLEKKLGLDTRVTTLGHVQRGGSPAAYDRYLATVQGVEAVEAVLRSTPAIPPPMIGIHQNKITCAPLMEAVRLTHEVSGAISKKDFKRAMELRDPDFNGAYDSYIESTLLAFGPGARKLPEDKQLRIAVMHTGAPAGGMNAAVRTAIRLCLNRGHVALGIRNGFYGLVHDEVHPVGWQEVESWQTKGGCELGTNRDHPRPVPAYGPEISPKGVGNFIDCGLIAYHLQKHDIQALMVVGGFEAYTSLLTLGRARPAYPAFCIPMVHLPATVSNNVPGTDFSLGSDTALNSIVEACDRIKLSANASRRRVFVVEVQGGNCGYLAVMGGLASGATTVYIPEEGITIDTLQRDIKHLCRRYREDTHMGIPSEGRLVLRNEEVSKDTYTTQVLSQILKAEGKGLFDSRTATLGHLQQGGIPSPLDRIRATRLAVNCVDWIQESAKPGNGMTVFTRDPKHCAVIGIRGAKVVFTDVETLLLETDVAKRRSRKELWWSGLPRLVRILAKQEYFEDGDVPEGDKEASI